MIYGEHLSAEEVEIKCRCGVTATVEIVEYGWHCRRCAARTRAALAKQSTIAKAIVKRSFL